MTQTRSFIEVQFPVSKLSKESYKERKAGDSQTLASLGKWHGRKPLVLVRALILGLLIPATDDPKRDRDVFLKLMTMDDEGMWRRCKGLPAREVAKHLPPSDRDSAIDVRVVRGKEQIAWKREIPADKRKRYEKRAFLSMGYDERLTHCLRPEEIEGPDEAAWKDINEHLGTSATNLPELVRELGQRRFGHVPRVGDAFAGGGSIPFEAARLGCDAFASDLNPTAVLQNYGALRLVGGSSETMKRVKSAQRKVFQTARAQVAEWRIERNEFGWEADVYLYCNEVFDPITNWYVPMLPSLVVDPGERVIVQMNPDYSTKTINLRIKTADTEAELETAKLDKTADDGVRSPYDRDGNYIRPDLRQTTSTRQLRGPQGIRLWDQNEWIARPDDVYQERLFCVRWILPDLERLLAAEQVLFARRVEIYDGWTSENISPAVNAMIAFLSAEDCTVVTWSRKQDWSAKAWELLNAQDARSISLPGAEWGDSDTKQAASDVDKIRRTLSVDIQSALKLARSIRRRCYAAPTEEDREREKLVERLLAERFDCWQTEGHLPSIPLIKGQDINRPVVARGWQWWHQLHNPRQLLLNGLFNKISSSLNCDVDVEAALLLSQMKLADWGARVCRWHSNRGTCEQVFYSPGLPTPFANYACRATRQYESLFLINMENDPLSGSAIVTLGNAASSETDCDLWITDPGYGDMVSYAQVSEFFLAWIGRRLLRLPFADYVDSKRALAVEEAGDSFAQVLHQCYANLAKHMPDQGFQVVMFTQQDAQVWADLTLLLWAAGLQVVQAWTIGTETTGEMRQGTFVQGTVFLILRKLNGGIRGDLSEIRPEVQMEVRDQLEAMFSIDDRESPNFADADYTLAAYAAALRVITSYASIREIDVMRELARGSKPDPNGIVRGVIEQALREATDFLVPDGLERTVWKTCLPEERLYLKGIEVEAHGERRNGVYQEFARGFGVQEYRDLLQSDAANETRLRTPSELKGRDLETGPMGGTVLRRVLYAIYQTAGEGMDPTPAIGWLRGKYPGMAFFDVRQSMVRMLRYLATKPSSEQMFHWKRDSEAAYLLAARLENEN